MTLAVICRLAGYGAWVELRQAFARGRLGTLAHTAGLAVLVALLGTLFGTILKTYVAGYGAYVPSLAAGLIAWTFLSSCLNRACGGMDRWARILRHTPMPLPAVAGGAVLLQMVILGQNLMVGLVTYGAVFGTIPTRPLALAAGIALVAANLFCLSLIGAILCLRYRNLPQSINGLLQVAFFLTPLIWPDYFLGRYRFLNDVNPFHHLVALIRAPLLGDATAPLTWLVGLGLLAAGGILAWRLHRSTRDTVCYWL